MELERFNAGLLGGNEDWAVEWWHNSIRSYLDQAHEHYQQQVAGLDLTFAPINKEELQRVCEVADNWGWDSESTSAQLWKFIDDELKELASLRKGTSNRRRLPETRKAITHKFSIQGAKCYLTVGLYDDGTPGELFITMAKEGSTIGGLMDSIGILASVGLQHGVPLETLIEKFSHTTFQPRGWTGHKILGDASSLVDYIFRWMEMTFVQKKENDETA